MASLPKMLHKTLPSGSWAQLRTICCKNIFSGEDAKLGTTTNQPDMARRNKLANCGQIRSFTSDSETAKLLTQSTMLVQEGTEIEELPVLIRRATRDSFPFSSHTYSGEHMTQDNMSEATISFTQMLQDCESVQDVFRLLEAPSDKLDGFSATFALERLHTLKQLNQDWNTIHSFIRSTLMGSLYGSVRRDVHVLPNAMLISLVKCYLETECFPASCIETVNKEIQVRLGDGAFSITELLTLSKILQNLNHISKSLFPYRETQMKQMFSESRPRLQSQLKGDNSQEEPFDRFSTMVTPEYTEKVKKQCVELHTNIWAHLALRYDEVDVTSLPVMLHGLPHTCRPLANLLEKRLQHIWLDLSPTGVSQCLDALVRLRLHIPKMMCVLGQWAYVNVHLVTPEMLLSFLNTFLHFNYLDRNLVTVIERCLTKSGNTVETDLLAMCVEYCRVNSYLSPIVLETAAAHFSRHWQSYGPLQVYTVLRAFGCLNYLPSQSASFMAKVEKCVTDRFDQLDPDHLLEILGSFTFLNVVATNFHKMVIRDDFFKKVGELKNPKKTHALMWLKVLRHSQTLSAHKDMNKCLQWVLSRRGSNSVYCYLDSQKMAIRVLKESLEETLGSQYFHVVPFYGCCALYLDKAGLPLKIVHSESGGPQVQGDIVSKLVLLLRSADHFTVNSGQLLGAQDNRKRQLAQLGFTTVELRSGELLFKGSFFLREQLSSFIDFHEVDRRGIAEEEVTLNLLLMDEYESNPSTARE